VPFNPPNIWRVSEVKKLTRFDVEQDDFLHKEHCDRCGRPLEEGRIMSWFTDETICMPCSGEEERIRHEIREAGFDDSKFEGCGFVPDIEQLMESDYAGSLRRRNWRR